MTATSEEILAGLKTWVELGALRWLDLAFAQFAAEQCAQAQAVIPLAAALVSGHNGHGHVCLDLADLWARPQLQLPQLQEADPRPLRQLQAWLAGWGLEHWLEQLEASGLAQARWSPDWDSAGTSPLVLDGGQQRPLLYLRRYWGYEQRIRQGIEQRLQPLQLPQGQVRGLLDGLFADDTAQPRPNWQKIACALAARSGFAIITGGPGTGKTTTVVRLLALLQGLRLRNGQPLLQVRLVAPTGKAAARLNESIAGSVQGLALDGLLPGDQTQHWRNAIPTEVSTLHRLLGSRPGSRRFRHHPGNPLALDLVVVDEASMVDVEMMASLVAALPDQARLILLGDKDQL
ncbi:MAG: AAA family ATPase, partial [Gammaproteobacteria bacterium SHHR-1]